MKAKWDELEGTDRLEALIDHVDNICSIPESSQKVMSLTRNQDARIVPVVNAIMNDPVLTTELLRLVNSPFFAQTKEVVDIRRAVGILGLQELHNLAAAVSMLSTFSSPHEIFAEFRISSLLSATLARLIATEVGGVDESLAFLAGLLSEIGAMACIEIDGDEYAKIWRQASFATDTRSKLEIARYAGGSEDIGKKLLNKKNLPDEVANAVGSSVSNAEGVLSRVTVFAREAAPLIIRATEEENVALLEEAIPGLAVALDFESIDADKLIKMCVRAGTTAEMGSQGEVEFIEETGKPDEIADHKPVELVSEAENEGEEVDFSNYEEASVRMSSGGSSSNRTAIIIGVCLAVVACAVAAYFVLG